MVRSARYLVPGRLEDVILLLQLLSYTDRGFIYDSTIRRENDAAPASEGASSWAEVAKEHPEFFRVGGETDNKAIQLLVRAAGAKANQERVPHELLNSLITIALQLHERQIRTAERRDRYMPLVVGLVAGLFTLAATLLPRWLGQ